MNPTPSREHLLKQIQELEQTVAQLQSEAAKYRTLFNALPHGITVSDDQGNILETNAAAETLLGVGRQEHVSRTIDSRDWRIIRPDGSDMPPDEWASVIALKENRTVTGCDMGIVKSDQAVTWITVTAAPLPVDGYGVVVVYNDITEKKAVEEQLRDSESRFRNFFESAGIYGCMVSPEGRILAVNQTTLDTLGYLRNDLVGRPATVLFHDDSRQEAGEIFQELTRSGRIRNQELTIRKADGSRRIVMLNADAVRDAAGDILHFTSIMTDISDLKDAEEALRKNQENFGKVADTMLETLSVITLDGLFLYANRRASANLSNDSLDDITGRSLHEFLPRDQADRLIGEYRRTYAAGNHTQREVRIDLEQGDRWFLNTLRPIDFGTESTPAVLSVSLDITDRKAIEMELQSHKELMEGVLDSIKDVIGVQLPDHTVLFYNRAGYELLGLTEDAVKGRKCYELLGKPWPCDVCATARATATRSMATIEKYIPELDRHFLCTSNPVLDSTGKPRLIIEQLADITEQKKMNETLKHVQKMEAVGSLAGGIAHDFNNLLFPIIGMAEMLIEDLTPGSLQHENAVEILTAGRRASELVKQILTFSRQSEHRMMPVRLHQVVGEALKLARSTIPSDIEIVQGLQADCPMVNADPTQMHQVAMNLITNAFHAVEPANGRITVLLEMADLSGSDETISDLPAGTYARLTVSDTGSGIDPAVMDKIFEPYFTTKGPGKGTGLGLAVVYGIVKEHGGAVRVASTPGRGTIFKVYLPVIDRSDTETDKFDPGETLATGTESILLVDDEEAVVLLERRMLERLGYRVTARLSSHDALTVFRQSPDAFDLVITDMTMPQMTGDRLARELFRIRPNLPVILCTGFSERINREAAEAIGIRGYLMKPVVRSEMAAMIRSVLDTPPEPGSKNN